MKQQEVIVGIPLELFGYNYICDKCGAEMHISMHDPYPSKPMTTYRKCGSCGVKIKMIWVDG